MATDQSTKIIPGIPLAALDAIEDGKIRDVLRALVSTHNVRNNLAGTGSDAFITTRQALDATRTVLLGDPLAAPLPLARYTKGGGEGLFGPGSLSGPIGTIHITLDRPMNFQATVMWHAGAAGPARTRIEIHDGGTVLLSHSDGTKAGYTHSHVASTGFRLDPGTHALTLHAGNDGGGSYNFTGWGMLVLPVAG